MKKPSLKEQDLALRRAARERGLGVRKDKRLDASPYRAAHPRLKGQVDVPIKKKCITYGTHSEKPLKKKVMDLRHELHEWDKRGQGWKYPAAHRFANRKQRTVGSVRGENYG